MQNEALSKAQKTNRKNSIKAYLAELGVQTKNGSKWLIEDHKLLKESYENLSVYLRDYKKQEDERNNLAYIRMRFLPKKFRRWLMGY